MSTVSTLNAKPVGYLKILCEFSKFVFAHAKERFFPSKAQPKFSENFNKETVRKKMFDLWISIGYKESEIQYFFDDAFKIDSYQSTIDFLKKNLGSLKNSKVIDIGCGWGSLSVLLNNEAKELYFVDFNQSHLEVTQLRVPSGKGSLSRAENITTIKDQFNGQFDLTILHSVIEHANIPKDHRGNADSTMEVKQQILKEMFELTKPGGHAFLNTGNYNFPVDGEVKLWFFHWLPPSYQKQIMEKHKLGADLYGLLTWKQMEQICTTAGFEVVKVESEFYKPIEIILYIISFFSRFTGENFSRYQCDQLIKLIKEDPNYMISWNILLKKTN